MTQTVVLTWVILAAGLGVIALAVPGVLLALRERVNLPGREPAAGGRTVG